MDGRDDTNDTDGPDELVEPVEDEPAGDMSGGTGGKAPAPVGTVLNPVVGFHATTPEDEPGAAGGKDMPRGTAATPEEPPLPLPLPAPAGLAKLGKRAAAPARYGNGSCARVEVEAEAEPSMARVLVLVPPSVEVGGVVVVVVAPEDRDAPLPDDSVDSPDVCRFDAGGSGRFPPSAHVSVSASVAGTTGSGLVVV